MQKNKFVHEDIRAVCSSAAKKLVALGVVAGIGTIGVSFHHSIFAQTPEEINRIKSAVNRSYERDLKLGLPKWLAEENKEYEFHCLMVAPLSIDDFERSIDDETILERGVGRIIENLRYEIDDIENLIEEMQSQENITEEIRGELERTLRGIENAQSILAQNTSVGNEHTMELDFSNTQETAEDIIENLRTKINDLENRIEEMQDQENITEEMREELERTLKRITDAQLTLTQSISVVDEHTMEVNLDFRNAQEMKAVTAVIE